MPTQFHLSVVAPDRSVVEESVASIVAPGVEGYFGVMAGHVPVITALRPGLLEYSDLTTNRHYVYIGGGFAEVQANKVTVIADEAEKAPEIDIAQAEQSLEAARRALRGEDSSLTSVEAVIELERAVSRIKAARSAR